MGTEVSTTCCSCRLRTVPHFVATLQDKTLCVDCTIFQARPHLDLTKNTHGAQPLAVIKEEDEDEDVLLVDTEQKVLRMGLQTLLAQASKVDSPSYLLSVCLFMTFFCCCLLAHHQTTGLFLSFKSNSGSDRCRLSSKCQCIHYPDNRVFWHLLQFIDSTFAHSFPPKRCPRVCRIPPGIIPTKWLSQHYHKGRVGSIARDGYFVYGAFTTMYQWHTSMVSGKHHGVRFIWQWVGYAGQPDVMRRGWYCSFCWLHCAYVIVIPTADGLPWSMADDECDERTLPAHAISRQIR